jgi:hypothetical protein
MEVFFQAEDIALEAGHGEFMAADAGFDALHDVAFAGDFEFGLEDGAGGLEGFGEVIGAELGEALELPAGGGKVVDFAGDVGIFGGPDLVVVGPEFLELFGIDGVEEGLLGGVEAVLEGSGFGSFDAFGRDRALGPGAIAPGGGGAFFGFA